MADVPKSIKASLYIDGKPAEASLKNIKQQTSILRREFDQLTIGTEEYNKKMKELQLHEKTLKGIQNEVKGLGGAFGWLKGEIGKLGALAVGFLGFQFITDQFQNTIMASAKLSDSLADIRRVAGLSEKEVIDLNKALKDLDTRTSIAGLRDIAVIGGKLGVAKDGIVSFTEAVDKLVVTLGDELGGADQITTQLGKILNVYDGKVTGENITQLGNAMVVMANAGVASGGFIADFTQRVSGIAVSAHLSLGATIGLAAGLEELGQKSESSSTAIQTLLTGLANDLPKAASIAKMPLADFQKLFSEKPEKALLAYASGLVKNKTAFADVAGAFKDAGEEGQRVIGTLAALGNKAEFMQQKIDLSNESLKSTSAINEGFALKNETFGASVDKLGKKFNALTANTTVTNFFTGLISFAGAAIDGMNKYAQAIANFIKILTVATVAWGSYKLITALATAEKLNFIKALLTTQRLEQLEIITTTALSAAKALFTGNLKKARQEWQLLSLAMEANPWGLAAAAIAAVVTAIVLFSDSTNDAVEVTKLLNKVHGEAVGKFSDERDTLESLNKIMLNQNERYSDRLLAMAELKKLMPDHLKAYSDEKILAGEATTAIKDYIKQQERRAEVEIALEQKKELLKERAKIQSSDGETSFLQRFGSSILGAGAGPGGAASLDADNAKANKTNALNLVNKKIEALDKKFENEFKDAILNKPPQDDTGSNPIATLDTTVAARRKKLEDAIKILKLDYEKLSETDKAGQAKNRAQQEALQKELDALDGKKEKPDKKAESELDQSKKLTQSVKEFNAQQAADLMAKNQKEIKDTENKYDHFIDLEKKWLANSKLTGEERSKHESELAKLQTDKINAVDKIRARQEEDLIQKIKELRISLGKDYDTELQKQVDHINLAYDQMLKDGFDKDTIEKERARDLAQAKVDEEKRLQDAIEELRAEGVVTEVERDKLRKARINKKYDDELADLKKKFSNELQATQEFQDAVVLLEKNRNNALKQSDKDKVTTKEKNKAILDASLQAAQDIANGVFEIGKANRQAETDAELSKLEKQKDQELSNKDLTEAQRTAITDKYAAKEREIKLKAWEADRSASLQQAEINVILAVTKAMTSAPWPLNLISAAGAAIAGGIEVAKISSMKPPEFATGGFSDQDPAGYVGQATVFKNSASGRPFVAGEAGREWIAPNWMLQNPRTANIIGMLESARKDKRAFAAGGYNGSGSMPVIHNNFDVALLADKLDMLHSAIQNQELTFNDRAYDKYRSRKQQIKDTANAG